MKKTPDTKEQPAIKEYDVLVPFWDGPHLRSDGGTVFKTPDAAKYYLPHVLAEKQVATSKPSAEPASVPAKLKG